MLKKIDELGLLLLNCETCRCAVWASGEDLVGIFPGWICDNPEVPYDEAEDLVVGCASGGCPYYRLGTKV
jgi:hypothetical protein